MAEGAVALERLAEAYRAATRAADADEDVLDAKILQAMLCQSAVDVDRWATTRLPGGGETEAVARIAGALNAGNVVGHGLAWLNAEAWKKAKAAAFAAVGAATSPVWLTAILGFLGAALVSAGESGRRFGFYLAGVLLFGVPVYFVYVARAAVPAASAVGRSLSAIWAAPEAIGRGAEQIYRTTVAPALTGVHELGLPARASLPALSQIRGWARAGVVTAFLLAAVALTTFASGVAEGWDEYFNGCEGTRLADGTCLELNLPTSPPGG